MSWHGHEISVGLARPYVPDDWLRRARAYAIAVVASIVVIKCPSRFRRNNRARRTRVGRDADPEGFRDLATRLAHRRRATPARPISSWQFVANGLAGFSRQQAAYSDSGAGVPGRRRPPCAARDPHEV